MKALSLSFFASILLFAATFVSIANADEHLLARIISEPEGNLEHQLLIETDKDNNFSKLIRRSYYNTDVYTYAELTSKEVVISKSNGYDAVLVKCVTNCSSTTGGGINLRYLYNGAFGTYYTVPVVLRKVGINWILYTKDNQEIHSLRITPHTFWGKLIGIVLKVNE